MAVARYKIWAFNHPKVSTYLAAIVGWRLILSVHDLWSGLGYTFGPPLFSSSAAFSVLDSFGLPIAVYGILMLATGLGILDWHGERFRWASWAAGVVWAFWSICFFIAAAKGVIGGWSGPMNFAVIAALQFRIASRR